jgi:hypothetical protein
LRASADNLHQWISTIANSLSAKRYTRVTAGDLASFRGALGQLALGFPRHLPSVDPKGCIMSHRTITAFAAAALCVVCVSTEALAYRAGGVRAGGVYHGGGYRGGVAWRGGAYRPGWRPGVAVGVGAAALGAAAIGAAAAAPYYNNYYDYYNSGNYNNGYYNGAQCGYAPYPPCY